MNTEALNTVKQIREVITVLQGKLRDKTLNDEEKNLLGQALINLYSQEDIIINNALNDMVNKLNASNDDLKNLITQMQDSTERLASFSETIKKISDVIGVLGEITSKAISAGLI